MLQVRAREGWRGRTAVAMAAPRRRNGRGRRSAANNWPGWRGSSRRIDTWPSGGGSSSRGIWAWTRRKSRSGFRTRGRRSRRRAGRRIRSPFSWWPRGFTIIRRFRWPRRRRNKRPNFKRNDDNRIDRMIRFKKIQRGDTLFVSWSRERGWDLMISRGWTGSRGWKWVCYKGMNVGS